MSSLIGIPELDLNILLKMDYHTLIRMKETNTHYQEILDSDWFWKDKLNHDYPGALNYKNETQAYQDYYELLSIGDFNDILDYDNAEIIDYFVKNKQVTSTWKIIALENDNLELTYV
jgi:hypothetical protein